MLRLQHAIKFCPDPIAAVDSDLRVIACNAAYQTLFQKVYDAPVDVGTSLGEALAGQSGRARYRLVDFWQRALRGEAFTVRRVVRDTHGDLIVLQATASPITDENGSVAAAWHTLRDVTSQWEAGREIRRLNRDLEMRVQERTQELTAANESLRAEIAERESVTRALASSRSELVIANRQRSELVAHLEVLLETAPIGFAVFDRSLNYVRVNRRLAHINGIAPAAHIGRRIDQIMPVRSDLVTSILHRVLQTGQVVEDVELSGEAPAEPGVLRHWLCGFYPVPGEGGVEGVGAVVVEITDRKRIEERQRELVAELDHRVKNTLATIKVLARNTHRQADTAAGFAHKLASRIDAMARLHQLLARRRWQGVDMRDLLLGELQPMDPEGRRVHLHGHDLLLRPKAASALALILHELATNAAEHGALSSDHGTIVITWTRQLGNLGDRVLFDWLERGVPAQAGPSRRGFGMRYVEHSAAHDLGGSAMLRDLEGGFRCRLELDAGRVLIDKPADPI